jgi:hypothetical protein
VGPGAPGQAGGAEQRQEQQGDRRHGLGAVPIPAPAHIIGPGRWFDQGSP